MNEQHHDGPACVICRNRARTRKQTCTACPHRLHRQVAEITGYATLLRLDVAPSRAVEAGIPLRLVAVDLTLPAVGGASAGTVHDPHGDQTGEIPVAARLDSWVQDWASVRDRGERLPVAAVPTLVDWLSVRLDWAVDEHPAVDEFATEIRELRAAMRRALSADPLPAVNYAAPCPGCGTVTLARRPGDDWIECGACRRLWGDDDYAELVRAVVPEETLLRTREAAVLAGVTEAALRKWVQRGKLKPLQGPSWGAVLYVTADVVAAKEDLRRRGRMAA